MSTQTALYIAVALFLIACAAGFAWLIGAAEPFDDDDAQGWPCTAAEYARSRVTSAQLAALPVQQTPDVDVSRLAHPMPPSSSRREEERRASHRLSKGW